MPIDERLRAGLPTALDDAIPDLDAALTQVLVRAGRRSRVRRAAYAVGLAAAAVVAAVTLGLGGDEPRRTVVPAGPTEKVRVLDAERGSADDPAPLTPGTYASPFIGAPDHAPWGQFEVPAGWGQDRLILATGPDLDPHLRRVELLVPDGVAPDPCRLTIEPVQAEVTDIVAALTAQRTVQPRDLGPAAIDGYSGRLVEARVPLSLDVTKCTTGPGLRTLAVGASHTSVFPGWTYRTWVLDVDGDPLVILAAHGPQTTPTELAELTTLVEGMRFIAPR